MVIVFSVARVGHSTGTWLLLHCWRSENNLCQLDPHSSMVFVWDKLNGAVIFFRIVGHEKSGGHIFFFMKSTWSQKWLSGYKVYRTGFSWPTKTMASPFNKSKYFDFQRSNTTEWNSLNFQCLWENSSFHHVYTFHLLHYKQPKNVIAQYFGGKRIISTLSAPLNLCLSL